MIVLTTTSNSAAAVRSEVKQALERLSISKRDWRRDDLHAELRLDLLERPEEGLALIGTLPIPEIVTIRRTSDGGGYGGDERLRRATLGAAHEAGAAFVDLEWPEAAEAGIGRSRYILSCHDSRTRAADDSMTEPVFSRLCADPPGLAKLVLRPHDLADLVAIERLACRAPARCTVFGLGELGRLSRWQALFRAVRDGGPAYVSASNRPAAPGQLTIDDLADHGARLLAAVDRGVPPRLFALLGNPTAHSISPDTFNALFHATGFPGIYETLPVPALDGLGELADRLPLAGLSVTAPHKVAILAALDLEADAVVRGIGAANTVWRRESGGTWLAANHDVEGVAAPLARRLAEFGIAVMGPALVLGSGGAARAAVHALKATSPDVAIWSRRSGRVDEWTTHAAVRRVTASAAAAMPWDVVVNATGAGRTESLGEFSALRHGWCRIAMEMSYVPADTAFLVDMRRIGAATIPGIEMFMEQARAQWRDFVPDHRDADASIETAARHAVSRRRADAGIVSAESKAR